MLSIKTTLISLALAAIAFAPVEAKTHESAIARRNAATAALNRRASSASSASGNGDYSANSPFLKTKAALAAARIRCGTAAVCEARAAAPPANGVAVCNAGRCTYRCNEGFAPGGADGTQCVQSQTACTAGDCDVPDNGFATCNTDGTCEIGCSTGFTRYSASNPPTAPFFCFATATDANNCGTPGNVCPASYNTIGEPICRNGGCRLSCPTGYFLRRAASEETPYYCYNGESSLVRN